MEIYYKDNKKRLQEITLKKLIALSLTENNFKTKINKFSDNSSNWISIVQERKNKQITTIISFDEQEQNIKQIQVFSADIKKVVDEENEINII